MSGGDRVSEDYKAGYLVPNKGLEPIDTAQIIADMAHVGRNMARNIPKKRFHRIL